MRKPGKFRTAFHARKQQGLVLFIALVTIIMLMLAGLAMIRSVDSTTVLTGNFAFREASTQVSDYGLESARAWLIANPTLLAANQSGYYVASADTNFNPKTFNWAGAMNVVNGTPSAGENPAVGTIPNGYSVQFVIHRMCSAPGNVASCFRAGGGTIDGEAQVDCGSFCTYSDRAGPPYYQITTRVVGPRNSVSYIQALVY